MKPIFFLLSISLILSACTPQATPALPTDTPTSTSTSVPTPTDEPTPTPDPLTLEKLSAMSHEEKINLMLANPDLAGVDANSTFCSEIQDNICVVDTDDDYMYYDLMKKKVVDAEDAGVTFLRLTEEGASKNRDGNKSYVEWRSFVDSGEVRDFLLIEEGLSVDFDRKKHPDNDYVARVFMQPENFTDLSWVIDGKRQEVHVKNLSDDVADPLVFVSDVIIDGQRSVLVRYINRTEELKVLIVKNITVDRLEDILKQR